MNNFTLISFENIMRYKCISTKITFLFFLMFISLLEITVVNTQEETCFKNSGDNKSSCGPEKNLEESYPDPAPIPKDNLKYSDLFLRQGHEKYDYLRSFTNNATHTEYFDIKISQEEIEYLKKEKLVEFPARKFRKYHQGNFLQFYRASYQNKLPVFFTIDSMLYPLSENKRNILYMVLDNILHPLLVSFYKSITAYIAQLRETSISTNGDSRVDDIMLMQAQIYFGAGHEFLIDKLSDSDYNHGVDVNKFIKGQTVLAKYYNHNLFVVMMKSKSYDTSSLRPTSLWSEKRERANIYTMLKWYQIARFDLKEDLSTIYLLGKLIQDSGMDHIYNDIREIYGYYLGEDKNSPNFLEVYHLAVELGFRDPYELSAEECKRLYNKIKEAVFSPDISILNDHILYTREQLFRFKQEREESTTLFNYKYPLEAWVFNKLTDYRSDKQRLLVSSIELIDAMHQASHYKEVIFNRYAGQKSHPQEQLIRYRDKVDVKENFEKAKYSIKKSMQNNPDSWRKNIDNNFHYLLYKSTRKIKDTEDALNVYKTNKYKEKSFYTAYGSYVHFKHELNLLGVDIPYSSKVTDGELPEVYIEPNLEFYNELNSFWGILREKTYKSLKTSKNFLEKDKFFDLEMRFKDIFDDFQNGIDICIGAIEIQLKEVQSELDIEFMKNLKKLIYYDEEKERWVGWYTGLFKIENYKRIFSYDVWVQNLFVARENKKINFPGAFVFNAMNFPYIGYIVVHDKVEKLDKLLLYSSYDAREFIKENQEKISFEDISENIINRD